MATTTALRRIQLGNALAAFGSGFTVPFLFVYVTRVRDMSAGQAGLMFSVLAVAALVVLPFVGPGIDRRGPRPVAVVGALVAAAGSLISACAAHPPLILAAAIRRRRDRGQSSPRFRDDDRAVHDPADPLPGVRAPVSPSTTWGWASAD
ncbi:MFS transporter [Yinghuangia aomiensis]